MGSVLLMFALPLRAAVACTDGRYRCSQHLAVSVLLPLACRCVRLWRVLTIVIVVCSTWLCLCCWPAARLPLRAAVACTDDRYRRSQHSALPVLLPLACHRVRLLRGRRRRLGAVRVDAQCGAAAAARRRRRRPGAWMRSVGGGCYGARRRRRRLSAMRADAQCERASRAHCLADGAHVFALPCVSPRCVPAHTCRFSR